MNDCIVCGAIVGDNSVHADWHSAISNLVNDVENLQQRLDAQVLINNQLNEGAINLRRDMHIVKGTNEMHASRLRTLEFRKAPELADSKRTTPFSIDRLIKQLERCKKKYGGDTPIYLVNAHEDYAARGIGASHTRDIGYSIVIWN